MQNQLDVTHFIHVGLSSSCGIISYPTVLNKVFNYNHQGNKLAAELLAAITWHVDGVNE